VTWAWAFLAMAWAGPKAIVAVGDGLVAADAPPAAVTAPVADAGSDVSEEKGAEAPTVAGGWVAVLADCLEERRPHQYALVDHTADHGTLGDARRHVAEYRELSPALVIVGVGVPGDADRDGLRSDLDGLVDDLAADHGPSVLLVGPVPTHDESGPSDRRTRAWNDDVERIAAARRAAHLDLLATWPPPGEERAGLTLSGRQLSDQGHARVGAQVCDAVLAHEAVP